MVVTAEADVAAVKRLLSKGRKDPAWFIEHVLGSKLWGTQLEIAREVISGPYRRVAVKSCHSSGKTHVAARIALAFFYLYPHCKVLTTAPTWVQVEKLLWAELKAAYDRIPRRMGGELMATQLRAGPDWWVLGLSTDQGVRFQGHHAANMLVVLDEAPGVKPDIWDAIESLRAGGDVRVLAIGNPTVASGPFYDAFTSNRAGWRTFSIDAFDTPNLAGVTLERLLEMTEDELDDNARPYLVTRRWVRERYDEWGEDHAMWQARVRAQFPLQADDSMYSLAWLEAAQQRPKVTGGGRVAAGLDVAGPGEDETVLCVREGASILELRAWPMEDPRGDVVAALVPYRNRLDVVEVDADGIGYYLAQHLKDQGFPVHEFHAGGKPREPERYANLKAEAYWGLRQRAQAGELSGLTDERAIGQLAGIRYRHNARGQVEVEPKEEARKRGVKSPDRAEAVVLAFADVRAQGYDPDQVGEPVSRYGGKVSW